MALEYYLYEEQRDGCGKRLRKIEGARSMNEALSLATKWEVEFVGEDEVGMMSLEGECAVDKATILEVANKLEINLALFRLDRKAAEAERAGRAQKQKDEMDFERLRKKLGKC